NPFDVFDKLELGLIPGHEVFYGETVDIEKNYLCYGNSFQQVGWYVTKNQVNEVKIDSIFLSHHDTVSYNLFY
ncbi:MAG: hypothetical protein WAS72_03565, partial [Saprospiraceae bacterium]